MMKRTRSSMTLRIWSETLLLAAWAASEKTWKMGTSEVTKSFVLLS